MKSLSLIPSYLSWHYSKGFIVVGKANRRLLSATEKSFSFSLILHTFFSPWKRMGEGYKKTDPGSWISTFIFNSLMRVLGVVIRSFIILLGLISLLLISLFCLATLIFWLAAPFIVIGLFGIGFKELLS